MSAWMERLLAQYKELLPPLSDTEQMALSAGTVGWESQMLRGDPDWSELLALPAPVLSVEEAAFMEGPVNELCAMVSDWQVTSMTHDLPEEVWQYIKDKGFWAFGIPKQYGGLAFSAVAHSEIIARLASRSSTLAVTVMVPNSLGPAELLMHYGTEEQKDYYLPRLAKGIEIPAFALTSPWAGSDAAAIPDVGIVSQGEWQGQVVLGFRVSWSKRYITLGPVCTILGLAFHGYDPEQMLGPECDLGITCALVPRDHPGVIIGRRHNPLDAAFMNGPTQGDEVFIPLSFVIGGQESVGKGWQMLMESLASGRSISLPSSSVGWAQMSLRAVGAYARVRHQFKVPIGRFEGVAEVLTRMVGGCYAMDALRTLAAVSVDQGQRPSVLSAMAKYHLTEMGRQVLNDAMDVLGGKGICLGPNNFMGRPYQQIPIGITVEGANILTRSLMIYGQGLVRCHPFLMQEMNAAKEPDVKWGAQLFWEVVKKHVFYALKNGWRAWWMGLTRGRGGSTIPITVPAEYHRYYQLLTHFSAGLAFLGDLTLLAVGGALKRRERLSARLGDILSHLTLASACLKRIHDAGYPVDEKPLVNWAVSQHLFLAGQALEDVLINFPNRVLVWFWKLAWGFPRGYRYPKPTDQVGELLVSCVMEDGSLRNRLTKSCFIPKDEQEILALLDRALSLAPSVEPILAKIHVAEKKGAFRDNPKATVRDMSHEALHLQIITEAEWERVQISQQLRDQIINVDDFNSELR